MILTEVQKVKAGSKITVGGETYDVRENWTSDLVLSNRRGEKRYLKDVIAGLGTRFNGPNHLVAVNEDVIVVTREPVVKGNLADDLRAQITTNKLKEQIAAQKPAEKKPSLTDSLKAQIENKGKQSLTDSLKAQVAANKEDQIVSATITAETIAAPGITVGKIAGIGGGGISPSQLAQKLMEQVKVAPSTGAADLKIGAVNAKVDTVRGQVAQVALRANEANVKAEAANLVVDELGFAVNAFAHTQEIRVGSLEQSVENLQDTIEEVDEELQEEVSDLRERIEALEDAESKRELQARFEKAIAAKTNKAQSAQNQGGFQMKNILSSFKNLFGKVEGQFALSLFGGIAIRKSTFSQEWVTYKEGEGITDVQGNVLTKFDIPAFRLPVEPKAVKKGDIIVAADGKYGYVTSIEDGFVRVTFPSAAAQGTVLPIKNPILGKAFYTQIKVLDFTSGETGGFDPMLLMALSGEGGSKESLLPLLLASGGLTGAAAGGQFNPMMLLALGGEGGSGIDDILPLLLLQQGGFAKEGINPLLFLALGDKTGKGKSDLLPLLVATGALNGGAAAGGFNPMMLLALGGGDGVDFKDIMMMQALGGGAGIFGAPAAAPKKDEDAE